MKTIKIVLAMAAQNKQEVHKMDVKSVDFYDD